MVQISPELRFFSSFLANPLKIASPVPSGPRLADAIAAQIGQTQNEPILELGAGTGAVTKAILDHGVRPSHLVAIERDGHFLRHLRGTFRNSCILEGDAFEFERLLAQAGYAPPLGAIICGVPVLSQPMHVRRKLLTTAFQWLRAGAPFIQFSYGSRPPIGPGEGACVERGAVVWQGILRLHVWVYRADRPV
jgi:phosphatidylethanolamine/phosphatidyl-N-methylethanolamine N-methyltransferase